MKKTRTFKKNISIAICWIIFLQIAGCKKFIEVDTPINSVNSGNVYKDDNTAIAVLTNFYAGFSSRITTATLVDDGITSLSWIPELTADNLTVFAPDPNSKLTNYFQNDLRSFGTTSGTNYWDRFYEYLYKINAAIERLSDANQLTPSVRRQLLGEAKFLRAFCYFYLVNIYGDVPMVLTTDYQSNATMGRTAKSLVYRQMITDLQEAKSLLNTQYLAVDMIKTSSERIRVNKGAATALLSRVYLYNEDYVNAEAQASEVIDNSLYGLFTRNEDINNVFLKNSKETIWSLQPVLVSQNTWEARVFILPAAGPSAGFPVYLSSDLVSKFASNDKRLQNWTRTVTVGGIPYSYAYKYKAGGAVTAVSEYTMILRLAEQYLIRAEARAQQGKLTGGNSAISDLNIILDRAGLLPSTAFTKSDILDAILLERRKEFFTEWGHRWFDLKRVGKIDAVMQAYAPVKGAVWSPYKSLYPISQAQIDLSPGMKGQQNAGY